MNKAYPDMLRGVNTTNMNGITGMEMSVLEQQNMVLKRQQEQHLQSQQQQQQQELTCFNELSMLSFLTPQAQQFHDLKMESSSAPVAAGPTLNELMNRPIKNDPGVEHGWMDFGMQRSGMTVENSGIESVNQISPSYGMNYVISRTASSPPTALVEVAAMKTSHSDVKCGEKITLKKRKAEKNLITPKVVEEEVHRSKRSKLCAKEEESKIVEQYGNKNCSPSKQLEISVNNSDKKDKENSGCTSKDNSKATEVQKSDYIHVRARRGQATDSHSLAERVRREKISERMRYLQDLVPGCNKITGKAGMLDEIINYVQSLQRQVEFLSMKLATVNPTIEFNMDDLIAKEILAACSSSLPTTGASADLTNPNYSLYNSIQQMDLVCGSELVSNSIDMAIRKSINAPVSMPDTFSEPSCFNQITNTLQWDADFQNIYNMEFQQGRSPSFPFQPFTGSIEPNILKMEL